MKDGVDCEKPQERLEAALQVGLVTLLHGGAYKCKVCDKEYVSKATIKPHLYTVLHYKKVILSLTLRWWVALIKKTKWKRNVEKYRVESSE